MCFGIVKFLYEVEVFLMNVEFDLDEDFLEVDVLWLLIFFVVLKTLSDVLDVIF